MIKVAAFKTEDGQVFLNEREAIAHEEQLLAQPLAERLGNLLKLAHDGKKLDGAAVIMWIRENEEAICAFMRRVKRG